MTDDVLKRCICRQLLELGVSDALENAPRRDEIFIAMQACLDQSRCLEGMEIAAEPAPAPATAPDGKPSRRKRDDRRSGVDRRQLVQDRAADEERRSGKERRSGGDRRGLLEGEYYTPQEAFLNLKAWCNGHCKAPFDLGLDTKTGDLRFRFEDDQDRKDFTEMLHKFKGMNAGAG